MCPEPITCPPCTYLLPCSSLPSAGSTSVLQPHKPRAQGTCRDNNNKSKLSCSLHNPSRSVWTENLFLKQSVFFYLTTWVTPFIQKFLLDYRLHQSYGEPLDVYWKITVCCKLCCNWINIKKAFILITCITNISFVWSSQRFKCDDFFGNRILNLIWETLWMHFLSLSLFFF